MSGAGKKSPRDYLGTRSASLTQTKQGRPQTTLFRNNSFETGSSFTPKAITETSPLTLKEMQKTISDADKLNFDLKMRIFYLEERLQKLEGDGIKNGSLGPDAEVVSFRELVDLKQKVAKRDREINELSRHNQELEQQLAALQTSNHKLQTQLERKAEEESRSSTMLSNKFQSSIEMLELKLQKEQARNQMLKTQKEEVVMQLEQQLQEYKDRAAMGVGSMARHAEQLEFLLLQDQQKIDQITEYQKEVLRLVRELEEVRGLLAERDRELGRVSGQVHAAKSATSQVKTRDMEIMRLKAEIAVLQDQLLRQSEDVDNHQKELQEIKRNAEEVCSLEAEEIHRLENEVHHLQGLVKSHDETSQLLHERLKTNLMELERAKAESIAYQLEADREKQLRLRTEQDLLDRVQEYAARLSSLQDQNAQLSWRLAAAAESQAEAHIQLVQRVDATTSQHTCAPSPLRRERSKYSVKSDPGDDMQSSTGSVNSLTWRSSISQVDAVINNTHRRIESLMGGLIAKEIDCSPLRQRPNELKKDEPMDETISSLDESCYRRCSSKLNSHVPFDLSGPLVSSAFGLETLHSRETLHCSGNFKEGAATVDEQSNSNSYFWSPPPKQRYKVEELSQSTPSTNPEIWKSKLEGMKDVLKGMSEHPVCMKEREELQALVDAMWQVSMEDTPVQRDMDGSSAESGTKLPSWEACTVDSSVPGNALSSNAFDCSIKQTLSDLSNQAKHVMERHKWSMQSKEQILSDHHESMAKDLDKRRLDNYLKQYMEQNEAFSAQTEVVHKLSSANSF